MTIVRSTLARLGVGKENAKVEAACQAGSVLLLNIIFHWPTAVSIAWTLVECCSYYCFPHSPLTISDGFSLFRVFRFECLLRLSRLSAVLMHELAHVVAAAVVAFISSFWINGSRTGPLSLQQQVWAKIRIVIFIVADTRLDFPNGMRWNSWLASQLLPSAVAPAARVVLPTDFASIVHPHGFPMEAIVRQAGLVASFMAPLLVSLPCVWPWIGWPCFLGVLLGAVGAAISDWIGGPLAGDLQPIGCFCCGNWGLLVPREALDSKHDGGLFPSSCVKLLTSILEVVELRGAQAGGCNTFLSENGKVVSVRSRVVKTKRGMLAQMLFNRFRKDLSFRTVTTLARLKRLRGLPVVLAQGHTRFGTSSAPAVIETHPHQWLGPHREKVWQFDISAGRWCRDEREVCVTVTHNGDFDGWRTHDQIVPNGLYGEWLARVLHHRNPALGDSPKLAGAMDLLACQGQWLASIRLAFSMWVMSHPDEACGWERLSFDAPNAVPDRNTFMVWADVFDAEFENIVHERPDFEPTSDAVSHLADMVSDRLKSMCGNGQGVVASKTQYKAIECLMDWLPTRWAQSKFCAKVCEVFFQNDLLSAVWFFFSRAEGTFGISVSSSLNPEQVVLAAKGQPISLAFDDERPLAFWASEPASLATSWPAIGKKRPTRAAKARWDLQDAIGEAVELRMVRGGTAEDHITTLSSRLQGTLRWESQYFTLPGSLHVERPYHIIMRGTSLAAKSPSTLLPRQFAKRLIRYRGPMFDRASGPRYGLDPVGADLHDVPSLLHEIDESWRDRGSLNRQSAEKFSRCLGYLVQSRETAGTNIDVLIYGVENSLWLGQQFAADLALIFPKLNVLAMSSNWVLGLLQKGHGHMRPHNWVLSERRFTFSHHAIVLGISQSGTTYPTVWATRLLSKHQCPLHIFAMSGDFDSVLANSVGQDPTKKSFSGCLFSTLSGVRPCEPSTVATLAMHHTLSQLLCWSTNNVLFSGEVPARFNRAADCRTRSSTRNAPACELSLSDVQDIQRLISTLAPTAVEMCGVLFNDTAVTSKIRTDLLRCGDYLASHLMEGYVAMLIGAVYIYLTVTFGVPLFSGIWSRAVASQAGFVKEELIELLISLLVSHIDAHIYVFLGAILATLHRWLYGRRLWTRYSARTVVIVDSTVNYKLLRAYLSKLRALAFRFTTFGVAGQNGQDHFVHEMTHLTTSEVILAVGRPDGRLATLAMPEAACIMSVQQARFIASKSYSGIEAISVSHNPWAKPGLFKQTVCIPTRFRPEFLSCRLLRTGEGPHPPGDVVSRIAALSEGEHSEGGCKRIDQDVPIVEVDELLGRMDCNTIQGTVSRSRAEEIIKDIVAEQARNLGVTASMFDIEPIMSSFMQRNRTAETSTLLSPTTSPKIVLKRNFSHIVPTGPAQIRLKQSPTVAGESVITASHIMSMLRGPEMQEQLQGMRKKLRGQDLMREALQDFFRGSSQKLFVAAFQAWFEHVRSEMINKTKISARRNSNSGQPKRRQSVRQSVVFKARGIDPSQDEMGQCSEWRTQEEIRRFARKKTALLMGQYRDVCFETWKVAVRNGRGMLRRVSMRSRSSTISVGSRSGSTVIATHSKPEAEPPISKDLIGKLEGKDLFAEISVLETLYETRVAAAERLLAFFIVFHKAVRPISRLPWLGFDMDRSESRLRVASTPAPVPFVEELSAQSPIEAAAQKLQRSLRQRRRSQVADEEETDIADCATPRSATPRSHYPPTFSMFASEQDIGKPFDQCTPTKLELAVEDEPEVTVEEELELMLQQMPNIPM